MTDAMIEAVVKAARAIADSFTACDGTFIHDDLTESEWNRLRDALDRLDAASDITALPPDGS